MACGKQKQNPIRLLVALDENYLPQLHVLLTSAAVNNPGERIELYFMHSRVSEKGMNRVDKQCGEYGWRLIPVSVPASFFEDAPITKRYPQEMYYRNFSVKQFGDSKKFELLQGKISSLLYKYGDFSEKESVFDELGLLKTPSYIHIKGNVSIFWKDGKCLDAAGLDGGVGISTTDVKKIVSVKIQDEKIVTIENLTSFFSFSEPNVCAVYLGGFCNHLRREFLMKVYGAEPAKKYFHYGDIDAGGFYIFEHLRTTTGIPFAPLMMNVDTLRKYKPYWKELTKNDVSRLQKIKSPIFQEVIAFMLKENCKLEQEAETLGGE